MKHSYIQFIVSLLFMFSYFGLWCAEGFAAGTLVKVTDGYTRIENLCVGDCVICYDAQENFVESSIVCIVRKSIDCYVRITVADECICVAHNQQLYYTRNNAWIVAASLQNGDTLAGHPISTELVNEPLEVYLISIAKHHNFLVTTADICAHNFFPPLVLAVSVAFGSGTLEVAGVSIGLAGLGGFLGYQWHKKSKQKHNVVMQPQFYGNEMMPEDPEEEKKRKRDEARDNYESLNNKEAKELAEKMGFKIDKNPLFQSYGKLVFRKGNTYISADRTGHKGGVWKVFRRGQGRLGTWNVDLTKKIGD